MVISVSAFAPNEEVRKTIKYYDNLRNEVLNLCYGVPGYEALPLSEKNKIYDMIKNEIEPNCDA